MGRITYGVGVSGKSRKWERHLRVSDMLGFQMPFYIS